MLQKWLNNKKIIDADLANNPFSCTADKTSSSQLIGAFFNSLNAEINNGQEKESIRDKKAVPRDHHFASLGKPCDVKG